MKKLLPLIAILVIGGVAFFFLQSKEMLPALGGTSTASNSGGKSPSNGTESSSHGGDSKSGTGAADSSSSNTGTKNVDVETVDEDEPDKPATELYKNAEDALKAIKAGAVDYDDRILEQFTDIGEDCSWCDSVYAGVKDLMMAATTTQDQKSFYAELLAVSGKVSNVASLIDAIKNAPNSETADAFSEALELTVGNNNVTKFLGDQLSSAPSEGLKESLIAAVTNQGSRLAVDILYKNTVEKGDPDGYYSLGIGLAEVVPEEEAMPYLQEIMLKRDQYSHLAAKSLLNNGLEGLKLVMNSLTNSSNPDFDKTMLKDAADHVSYDDETKDYLNSLLESNKDPVVQAFAKEILESSSAEESSNAADGGEEG